MWTMRSDVRLYAGGGAVERAETRGGDHLRRRGRRPSAGAERRPAGRHDPARRRMPSSSATSCCPVKTGDAWITAPQRCARHGALPGPASASSRRTRRCWRACDRRIRPPRCGPRRARITGTSATSSSPANQDGFGDIIQLGDGSSAQNSLAQVPHHIVLNHVYVHGDPLFGQKRGIALNAAHVTISDSYISDCKASGRTRRRSAAGTVRDPSRSRTTTSRPPARTCCSAAADPAIAESRRGRRDRSPQLLLAADVVAAADRGDAAGRDRRGRGRRLAARRYLRLSRDRPPRRRTGHDRAVDRLDRSARRRPAAPAP